MKTIIALALLAPAAAQAAPYRALGTEPFWSLTIDKTHIRYRPADGRPLTVRKPRAIVGINGELYRIPLMTVDITHVRCSDGMSDRTYADMVTVRLGKRQLRGCGGGIVANVPPPPGPLLPPPVHGAPLDGTSWTPLTIDGRPLAQTARARLSFERGNVSANAGCNGMGGDYRIVRGRLFADRLIGTQMACAPAVMAQERAMGDLLREGAEMRMTPGRLELVSRTHRATFARR